MDISAWSATNGDPTVWGWLIVAAYFLAAMLCAKRVAENRQPSSQTQKLRKRFWLLALGLLLVLGINKQLDLQSLFTLLAKQSAIENGWYAQRKIFQQWFIVAMMLFAILLLITLCLLFSAILKDHKLAISGMVLLVGFVVIRATSFHHMDQLIGLPILGTSMNFILEITGICLIAVNAGLPNTSCSES